MMINAVRYFMAKLGFGDIGLGLDWNDFWNDFLIRDRPIELSD